MSKYLSKRNLLILLSVVFFLIAWNRAINLLYGMFALLSATLILSLILPRYSVRGIHASRTLLPTAFEGEVVPISVQMRNDNRSSRFMIQTVDFFPAAEDGLRMPMSFVAKLEGKASREYTYQVTCYKRGEYAIGPLRIRSAYPLGIASVEKTMEQTVLPLLVYPQVFEISRLPLVSGSSMPMSGVEAVSKAGGSEEFFGTREYRQGDSLRYIHWPSTARHSQMIVKEFEIRAATEVTLLLDLHKDSDIGTGKETTLEYAVKIAASIAQYALQRGHAVQLAGYGKREHVIPVGCGLNRLAALLEELARVKADGTVRFPQTIRRSADLMRDGGIAVLICCQQSIGSAEFLSSINLLMAKRTRLLNVVIDEGGFFDPPRAFSLNADPVIQELMGDGAFFYTITRGADLPEVFAR
jgi:uncharacterized protein (DUF58 family)